MNRNHTKTSPRSGRWSLVAGLVLLVLLAVPTAARTSDVDTGVDDLRTGAVDRLVELLVSLPAGWTDLPRPTVAVSGRLADEVIHEALGNDQLNGLTFVSSLALTPFERRADAIRRQIEIDLPQEADVWMPRLLVSQQTGQDEAALVIEAWMQWAAALGRRDVLFFAASEAVDIVGSSITPETRHSILRTWLDLPDAEGSDLGKAWLTMALASRFKTLGNGPEAADLYRRAQARFRAIEAPHGQAYALDGEAESLARSGRTREALGRLRAARELFRDLEDRLGEGNTHLSEAEVFQRLGELAEARRAYRRAHALYVEIDDGYSAATAVQGEADMSFRIGDIALALDGYREAKALFQAAGSPIGAASSLIGEADVHARRADFEAALRGYREAREIFDSIGHSQGKGHALEREADILHRLGENEVALTLNREARSLFSISGDRLGFANTLQGEANLLAQSGWKEQAVGIYEQARSSYRHLGESLGEANTWRGQADILLSLGRVDEALAAYREARRLYLRIDEGLGEGNALNGEAKCRYQLKDYRGAAETAAAAARRFQAVGSVSNLINARLYEASARRALGEFEAAIRLAEQALRGHERFRQHFVAETHRTQADHRLAVVYEELIPLLVRRPGSRDVALSRVEEAKSRVLLDLLSRDVSKSTLAPSDWEQENRELQRRLALVASKLEQETDLPSRRDLLAERVVLDGRLQYNHYLSLSADLAPRHFGDPLDADRIRQLASDVGPLLLFYVSGSEMLSFLVSPPPEEMQAYVTIIDRETLAEMVEGYVYDLSNPIRETQALKQAEGFWELLISPFADHLNASSSLTLIPHGPLHQLPFESLVEPGTGKKLFERWHTALAPSASALALARKAHRRPRADDNLVSFAAGVGLHVPHEDLREIARLFPASRQETFGPTEAEFPFYRKVAGRADHLLITTRGVHQQGSHRGSYLEIRPTEAVHDARLSAAEIAMIPLQSELVALAACDTDRGDSLLSDERLTLTRSFLIAGAASVLATRWRVPEGRGTTRFLVDFYTAYRQGSEGHGMRKDQALTEARRMALKRKEPAQIWAAWVLIGDAR